MYNINGSCEHRIKHAIYHHLEKIFTVTSLIQLSLIMTCFFSPKSCVQPFFSVVTLSNI